MELFRLNERDVSLLKWATWEAAGYEVLSSAPKEVVLDLLKLDTTSALRVLATAASSSVGQGFAEKAEALMDWVARLGALVADPPGWLRKALAEAAAPGSVKSGWSVPKDKVQLLLPGDAVADMHNRLYVNDFVYRDLLQVLAWRAYPAIADYLPPARRAMMERALRAASLAEDIFREMGAEIKLRSPTIVVGVGEPSRFGLPSGWRKVGLEFIAGDDLILNYWAVDKDGSGRFYIYGNSANTGSLGDDSVAGYIRSAINSIRQESQLAASAAQNVGAAVRTALRLGYEPRGDCWLAGPHFVCTVLHGYDNYVQLSRNSGGARYTISLVARSSATERGVVISGADAEIPLSKEAVERLALLGGGRGQLRAVLQKHVNSALAAEGLDGVSVSLEEWRSVTVNSFYPKAFRMFSPADEAVRWADRYLSRAAEVVRRVTLSLQPEQEAGNLATA